MCTCTYGVSAHVHVRVRVSVQNVVTWSTRLLLGILSVQCVVLQPVEASITTLGVCALMDTKGQVAQVSLALPLSAPLLHQYSLNSLLPSQSVQQASSSSLGIRGGAWAVQLTA